MNTTDRDYADKRWLAGENDEPMPLPVFIMEIAGVLIGAVGIAILITVALNLQ